MAVHLKELEYSFDSRNWIIKVPLSVLESRGKRMPSGIAFPNNGLYSLEIEGFNSTKMFTVFTKSDHFYVNETDQVLCHGFEDDFDKNIGPGYVIVVDASK